MLSPATQAESLGCFSQRSQNVLAVKPPPRVPGLLAREVLRVGGGCGALEGSLEEVASCGWRRVETSCDEQRKTREGFLLEYMNPEFPSHLHTAAGNQVSYKVGSWKYP